jgi:hypothetical protein
VQSLRLLARGRSDRVDVEQIDVIRTLRVPRAATI